MINNLESIYFVYQGTNFKTMQTKLSEVFDPFQLSPLSKLMSIVSGYLINDSYR